MPDDPETVVLSEGLTEAANIDWIRASRLTARAAQGDEQAKKELEDLRNEPVFFAEV